MDFHGLEVQCFNGWSFSLARCQFTDTEYIESFRVRGAARWTPLEERTSHNDCIKSCTLLEERTIHNEGISSCTPLEERTIHNEGILSCTPLEERTIHNGAISSCTPLEESTIHNEGISSCTPLEERTIHNEGISSCTPLEERTIHNEDISSWTPLEERTSHNENGRHVCEGAAGEMIRQITMYTPRKEERPKERGKQHGPGIKADCPPWWWSGFDSQCWQGKQIWNILNWSLNRGSVYTLQVIGK